MLAVLVLPAASLNTPAPTEIEPEPVWVFAVGVKTAEYTVDDVEVNEESVPPDTVMSLTAKSFAASESVKVNVSVWPERRGPEPLRVMATVGAVESLVKVIVCVEVNLGKYVVLLPVPPYSATYQLAAKSH